MSVSSATFDYLIRHKQLGMNFILMPVFCLLVFWMTCCQVCLLRWPSYDDTKTRCWTLSRVLHIFQLQIISCTFPCLQVQFLLGRQGPAQCLNMTDDPMKIYLIPRNGDKPIVRPYLLLASLCMQHLTTLCCKMVVLVNSVPPRHGPHIAILE